MSQTQDIIRATQTWLDDIVIAHNFCPFARFVRTPDRIHYTVIESKDPNTVIEALEAECKRLDEHPQIATTLIMLAAGFEDFNTYLDLLDEAQYKIGKWNYAGVYQLASFHPDYLFGGEDKEAPSHFTNRSPYPTLHLIREDDISRAMADINNPDSIYEDNIACTNEKGKAYFEGLLAHCKKGR